MSNITPAAGNEALKKKGLIAMIVGFVCGGIIPGVLGLLGYLKADTEPVAAAKFIKWAWIVFAIVWVLNIVIWGILIATGAFTSTMTTY